MKEDKTTLFSIQMSAEDKERFKAIAERKGTSMAGVLRQWIRGAHKRMEASK